MNQYKVYTLKSNKSMNAEGKYPQEALIDLVSKKMKIDKKYISCMKANSISSISNSVDYPFVVVGMNRELYFYNIKVNKEATIRAKEVKKGLKPAMVFNKDYYDKPKIVYFNPKIKTPSDQIWSILTQLYDLGLLCNPFRRDAHNFFSGVGESYGGSDYDNPYLRIKVDDKTNTMEFKLDTSRGAEITGKASCNNMEKLKEFIADAEMWR